MAFAALARGVPVPDETGSVASRLYTEGDIEVLRKAKKAASQKASDRAEKLGRELGKLDG